MSTQEKIRRFQALKGTRGSYRQALKLENATEDSHPIRLIYIKNISTICDFSGSQSQNWAAAE